MERLFRCSRCNTFVQGGLDGLSKHLKDDHHVQVSQPGNFICGQDNCGSTYRHFRSLRAHITASHGGLVAPEGALAALHHAHVPENPAHIAPPGAPVAPEGVLAEAPDENEDSDVSMEANDDGGGYDPHPGHECCILPISEDESEDNDSDPDDPDDPDPDAPDDNIEVDGEDDPRVFAARLLLDLQAKPNMTGTMVTLMINRTEELVNAVVLKLRRSLERFLQRRNIENNEDSIQLLTSFTNIKPFHKMKSLKGQEAAFKKYFQYIKPVKVQLPGYRYEQRLNREGLYVQRPIPETFIYISPLKHIEMMLNHVQIRQLVASEVPSPDSLLCKDIDGTYCQDHEFLLRHPRCIRIQLYSDGLETCNALSSRKLIHKVDGFYMRVMNLPMKFQSKLGAIQLVMLINSQDLKKYGFTEVLKPLVADLKILDSEEGALMIINGAETRVHATMTSFAGDSESVHEIFGLLGSGANVFCRACLITRREHNAGTVFIGEMRNRENHAQQLAHVNRNADAASQYGLREDSALNALRYFHTTNGYSWDLMHDILRGVGDSVLKLVLKKYTLRIRNEPPPILSVQVLNNRVNTFVYGYVDRRDKPSSNFSYEKIHDRSHDLTQKAVQMWCLLRVFPFLVQDLIPEDDPYMEFYLLFLRIITILFSGRLKQDFVGLLDNLLRDYQTLRTDLFEENPINKDHHLRHKAEALVKLGNLLCYDCLCYERFHGQIRVRAGVCHNFKDITLTTSRTCQMYQCSVWSGPNPAILNSVDNVKKASQVLAQSLEGYPLLRAFVAEHDLVKTATSLCLYGTEYRPKLFVIVEPPNNTNGELPVFAVIEQVLLVADVAYAITSTWRTVEFAESLNAYQVEDMRHRNDRLVNLRELEYHQPLSIWRPFGSTLPFLCPRHVIF